jgi:hypothetical protein
MTIEAAMQSPLRRPKSAASEKAEAETRDEEERCQWMGSGRKGRERH